MFLPKLAEIWVWTMERLSILLSIPLAEIKISLANADKRSLNFPH
jgi:hypothetical protein